MMQKSLFQLAWRSHHVTEVVTGDVDIFSDQPCFTEIANLCRRMTMRDVRFFHQI